MKVMRHKSSSNVNLYSCSFVKKLCQLEETAKSDWLIVSIDLGGDERFLALKIRRSRKND
jgi:hypothetical protein